MKTLIVVLLSLALTSCNVQSQQHTASSAFEKGKTLSELTNKKLKELSGLTESHRYPGMFWTHNDSGNNAEIFLIDRDLNIKMVVTLQNIDNRDWEDLTVGPGPDAQKSYVYVGDIGDNDAVYPYKYIYWFEEPEMNGNNIDISLDSVGKITFQLEGAVKDTESLFIDPTSKDLYVISKRENPVALYRLNAAEGTDTLTARKIMNLPQHKTVSADYSPKDGLLIKNYDTILWWENKQGMDLMTLLKESPVEVPYEKEPQGESIAWLKDGSGFYTISETKKKTPTYLWFYERKPHN